MEFKLKDLVNIKYGKNQKNVKNPRGKYPILGTGGIMDYADDFLYDKPSVLIGRKGSIGKVKYIEEPFWTIDTLFYTIVNENLVIPKYLYYKLSQIDFNYYNEGTTIPSLRTETLYKIDIDLPKKNIQKKVVNLLNTIDEKIENNQKIIANLEKLSQTLFKRWFVDFEFPDENGNPYKSSGGEMIDSELGEIPSGWKVDELGNYIKIKSGKRPKNKVDKKDIENVVPIIGASKIMGYTNDYLYNEKIIIIGRVGTHGVIQRFSTRTWPSDNTFVIISDFESIIYQVLKSIDYISLNRGSTQPLLSQKDIKNTKVAMPTNETLLSTYQKENNHILKMMDQKNIENQKLTQLRDTLLPKLMSGEIEIPDDIEVNNDELSI
ncbi:TPA: restriction endonuclease subunit S [Staphylococcus aureus]|uniref:restriction endonuclease subunit S n=1 Tax=Staphylococcus aureus TaxID=1280 RepID=UPI000F79D35F|nr:restriction endonuclease subunit S [Staphylococcus aureus]HDG5527527.1 restriction endonuclease subunit S [Staphylococcus aureus]HDJ1251760.1 restriction endonuclease subunit S [Staphylococcus aureus]